jgi:hypothetical protein
MWFQDSSPDRDLGQRFAVQGKIQPAAVRPREAVICCASLSLGSG